MFSRCKFAFSSSLTLHFFSPIIFAFGVLFSSSLMADNNFQSLYNFQKKMAEQGNSEAMIKLGEMSEDGLGTEQSDDQAREWYQHALERGNPTAQVHLNRLATKLRQAQEKVAREKAAQEKAAQEKAAQEKAAQEKAAQEKIDNAARSVSSKKDMTPEEKAQARAEAIRHAEEAYQQSLAKQLAKEKAESDELKRERTAVQ